MGLHLCMAELHDQINQIRELATSLRDKVALKKQSNNYDASVNLELAELDRYIFLVHYTAETLCNDDSKDIKLSIEMLMNNAISGAKKLGVIESRIKDPWIKKYDAEYREMFLKIKTIYSQKR